MKRLVKNWIYVAVLFILITVIAAPNWSRGGAEIAGNSPFEKTQALMELINQDNQDFAKIFLSDMDYQASTWTYTLVAFYSVEEMQNFQELQVKHFSLIEDIFRRTADFKPVNGITVIVYHIDGRGITFRADKRGIENIRQYPEQTLGFLQNIPMAMMPIDSEQAPKESKEQE